MPKANYSIDLIKQMAECDANYIRLLRLIPQLATYRTITLSKNDDKKELYESLGYPDVDVKDDMYECRKGKALEGSAVEFCIADFIDSNQRVTVQIKILESFRYTNTLEIVQKPEGKKWLTNPSMVVRVYHDASTAEVISSQGHTNFQPRYLQRNPMMYQTDEKMRVNAFLGEWLTHCLQVGRSVEMPEVVFKI
tara:strand:+ start:123 stop:704 length:582 start_codon:yes stop_codon:yes gene_type:complete